MVEELTHEEKLDLYLMRYEQLENLIRDATDKQDIKKYTEELEEVQDTIAQDTISGR